MNQVADLVAESEYLKTIGTSRDEFDHGTLIRRSVTGTLHGSWTSAIVFFLMQKGLFPKGEVHVNVAEGKYRIPDVLVLRLDHPQEEIVVTPPEAVFEVLSPGDLWDEVEEKFRDYENMGIPVKLLVNPKTKVWKAYHGGDFRVQATPVRVGAVELNLLDIEQYVKY
jgi:Uma2 family endonuclease